MTRSSSRRIRRRARQICWRSRVGSSRSFRSAFLAQSKTMRRKPTPAKSDGSPVDWAAVLASREGEARIPGPREPLNGYPRPKVYFCIDCWNIRSARSAAACARFGRGLRRGCRPCRPLRSGLSRGCAVGHGAFFHPGLTTGHSDGKQPGHRQHADLPCEALHINPSQFGHATVNH